MDKTMLLEILNTTRGWDLIDLLILSDKKHFNAIAEIYTLSCLESNIYIFDKNFIKIFSNIFINLYFWYTNLQNYYILNDNNFALEQYKIYLKSSIEKVSFSDWLLRMQNMSRLFSHINIGVISISQFLYTFKNYIYKNETFYTIFTSKLADYILEAYNQNNLSSEIVDFLIKLTL